MCVKPLNLVEQIRRSTYEKGILITHWHTDSYIRETSWDHVIPYLGTLWCLSIALGKYSQSLITAKMPRRLRNMTTSFSFKSINHLSVPLPGMFFTLSFSIANSLSSHLSPSWYLVHFVVILMTFFFLELHWLLPPNRNEDVVGAEWGKLYPTRHLGCSRFSESISHPLSLLLFSQILQVKISQHGTHVNLSGLELFPSLPTSF